MKSELETMLQLRPGAPWTVPVLLTEASRDRGIDELMAAIAAHRTYLASDGAARLAAEAHRQREFLEVLSEALTGRLEGRIEQGYAGLMARVRRGEQDPYSAALEVLRDRDGLRRLIDGTD